MQEEKIEEHSEPDNAQAEVEPDEKEQEAVQDEIKEPTRRRGCLRGCLMPVATILIILLIAVMVLYSKRDVMREILLMRIVSNTQTHVLSNLPEDMDSKEIESEFDKVKNALKAKKVDEGILTEAIQEYQNSATENQSLNQKRETINKLMEGLNAAIVTPERP